MPAPLEDLTAMRAALRALPPLDPPAAAWPRIARQLANQGLAAPRPMPQRVPAGLASAAALVLLAVACGFASARLGVREGAQPRVAAAAAAPRIGELQSRSLRLEAALRQLPQRPAVELAANVAAIDALQDRILWVDGQLAGHAAMAPDPAREQALWHVRVQLLDSLVGVRYAEAVGAGHFPDPVQGGI